jgi:aspartate ammonia-lyase
MAAEAGQLELNAFEPVIARSLLMSIGYLRRGCHTLTDNCVLGITANEALLRQLVENSIGLVTALTPKIGYENATRVAQHAQQHNLSVRQSVTQLQLMTEADFDELLGDIDALIGPQDMLPELD